MGEAAARLRSRERADTIQSNAPARLVTERLSRQPAIIHPLRETPERPNVSALARQFHVSRKTIQRDLHELVARGQLDTSRFSDIVSDLDPSDA
jgi:predicted HTH transcriptional regulator